MILNKILKTISCIALLIVCAEMNAQTPAQQLSKYVDPFTGNFSYNLPLVTVGGPSGEEFPLTLNYSGGITTNQEASWVGLGWSLNLGEISRQVKGMPDDFRNISYKKEGIGPSGNWTAMINGSYFGPLYFSSIYSDVPVNGAKKLDMYVTNKDMNGTDPFPFTFPDFDSYYVSGPGIGAEMRPFLFDYAELPAYPSSGAGTGSYTNYYTAAAASYVPYPSTPANFPGMREFTKKPQFRFLSEPMAEVKSDLTQNSYAWWNSYKAPEDPLNVVNPWNYYRYPDARADGNRNDWYNRANDVEVYDAANYVEYFTNSEIDVHYDGATQISGFLDYEIVSVPSDRDSQTKYDGNGIGAFRVTTPDGMIYHYSLPLYMRDEKFTTVDLNSWSILNDVASAERHINGNKYAYTWKLTAITDNTYEDTNNNNYPDEGDKGYWIKIHYSKWSDNYSFKNPYYSYNADASTTKLPADAASSGQPYNTQGSFSEGNSELYYPEYIKTGTQTAYFIKGVRNDEHSVADGSGNYVPKLFLKYIVLMDNEDVTTNNVFASPQAIPNGPYTGLSTNANTTNTLSTEDYTYYQNDIETYALKTIDFEFDYHLAQNLYNNIQNNFTETPVLFGGATPQDELYKHGVFNYTLDANLSGKLTLNKLTSYELNHEQFLPEHVFQYNTNNPNYNHEKHDIYGYYMDNYDSSVKSRYITSDNDKVDAWSLTKITSLGGVIDIGYESDSYTAVGYDGQGGMPYKPSRVFGIGNVDFTGSSNNTVNYNSISVGNNQVDYYFPLATKKYVYFSYNSNDFNCNCNTHFNDAFTGTLSAGSPSIITFSDACFSYGGSGCFFPTFNSGYLYLQLDEVYGGGTRVNTISITDPSSSQTYKLTYEYDDGLATTEPDAFGRHKGTLLERSRGMSDRHALNPNVGYAKTKMIIGDATTNIGSTEYTFRNMSSVNMLIGQPKIFLYDAGYGTLINYNHYIAYDLRSLYGRINSITNLDKNDIVVTKSTYQYGDYIADPRSMTDELFYDFYESHHPSSVDYQYKRIYWKKTFNTHLKKVTHFKDGMITTNEYRDRDNYTGVPTTTITLTPTVTSVKYDDMAYSFNSGMGAKTSGVNNANLLLPKKQTRITGAVGGSSSNWSNSLVTRSWDAVNDKYITSVENSIWSPVETFMFNGVSWPTYTWKKKSHNSLFGGKEGKYIVEQKDMKDRYTAIKNGYDERYKIAEVKNCNYASFAFSSFESTKEVEPGLIHFDGEIEKVDGNQVGITGAITPHTGNSMVEVLYGEVGPLFKSVVDNVIVSSEDFERGIQVGRTYMASVWVHKNSPIDAQLVFILDGNVSINKTMRKDSPNGIQIGDWIQLNLTLSVPDNYVSSGGGGDNDFRVYVENPTSAGGKAYFDDLVIHPVDAQFTGYIMDKRLGLVKAVINNENFYTRFEHDNAGNIIGTYKETQNGEKVLSTNQYNYD